MTDRRPAAVPAVLLWAALAAVIVTAAFVTPADADLWGHLTFGRDILASRTPVLVDQYSFTSDRPWINHEWLSEVTFAAIYRFAGSPGLIVFKVAVIAALLAGIWRFLRREGHAPAVSAALVTLAFAGTYWRTHNLRPQLFSVLLFAILLVAMRNADDGRPRWLMVVPPLMAVWVNLHGGWIVGLGVFGLWAAWRTLGPGTSVSERAAAAAAGALAVGATLISPYGLDLWRFLAETVRLGRADVEDWNPIWTSAGLLVPWTIVLATAAFACWRSKRRPRLDSVAIVLLLAVASFRVSRLDAFFALAVVVLLAPAIAEAWATFRAPREAGPAAPAPVVAIAVAAMLVPVAVVVAPYATCITMATSGMAEPEAAAFIMRNHLTGRLLTWFDWGEYAIWFFGPDLQVSMDGRRETVYTDRAIQAHRRFFAAAETGVPLVRALNPDYVWLPRDLPAAAPLIGSGWKPIFSGPISVVLARPDSAATFAQVTAEAATRRCFPGP